MNTAADTRPASGVTGRNAFVVVALVFVSLLVAAGVRSAPGVLILPLEQNFGWPRGVISAAAALGIFLYGLVGPFAAALMQGFGVRRTLMGGLLFMSVAALLSSFMTQSWQLIATWGVLSGLGTGCVSIVLGGTIVNRWFVKRRGLMMGLLTASMATGTLIFLPAFAALATSSGWRSVVYAIAAVTALMIPLVWRWLPEWPSDVGAVAYGASDDSYERSAREHRGHPLQLAFGALGRAVGHRDFWLLFGTFFVCGFTTNGLVGTHLIAFCGDHGITEVRAASLLAVMGVFDLVGTTLSGWLTDRFDSRKLLFVYYGLRGLALVFLPYSDFSVYALGAFTVFFGLDWVATVPPTLRLATRAFGERDAPIVFGWVVAGHQMGAASAALLAGLLRSALGSYTLAFAIAGFTGLAAAVMALLIAVRPAHRPVGA
ncbi:MAG: MFS transporter [Steroidobacteraceae bacterium]